jgi:hypothetical protein
MGMTHAELLSKTMTSANVIDQPKNYQVPLFIDALRAVVELHYPRQDPASTCSGCSLSTLYPCATIQAIEKELQSG